MRQLRVLGTYPPEIADWRHISNTPSISMDLLNFINRMSYLTLHEAKRGCCSDKRIQTDDGRGSACYNL